MVQFYSKEKRIAEVTVCTICKKFLPYKPRPVFSVNPQAKILIIGQAPGQKVHDSGIPLDDNSGDELRRWLGVSREQFYNNKLFCPHADGFLLSG
jgi:uracil-DNA glycosylase